mgnify:FL=1
MKNKTIKKVLNRLKKYRFAIVVSILLAAVTAAAALYVPKIVGEAIDLIVGKNDVDFGGIASLLVHLGIVVGATGILQWIMGVVNNRITFGVVRDLRNEAAEKLKTLPISFIDAHYHGDIVSRVIADADQFADGLLLGFSQLFTGVVTILLTLGFMLAINPLIALIVVVLTPVSLFIAAFIAKNTHKMFSLRSETRGEQTAMINELIGQTKVVRAFGHEQKATEEFDEVNERLRKCSLRATFFSSIVNPSTRFVNGLIYAAVSLAGALAVIASGGASLSVGGLTCLLSYATQYAKPFNEISGVVTEMQNALVCAERLFSLIEEPSEISDEGKETLTDVEGRVTAENVCFSYVKDKKLIENLNLSVEHGQRIAIVGPTGCGKSTIINLLMRFYDVCSGAIKVDGKDIRDITRDSLRAGYGMVLQETWLRSGTVRENIIMGKPDATDEEVVAAAKKSHAHGFITRLPNGYDTVLSEDGGRLSQGQKQLLCITRVMLALPPMLILDEATSSIDTRTEQQIQKAFAEMMKGRTSFIVAHRLSTIREADLILVMKEGKIIEQGTHDELLAKKGFYSELYESQFAH